MQKQCCTILTLLLCTSSLVMAGEQWTDGQFHGRIAYSADGNFNDEDDWAASAFALAIFHEFGVQDQLVHFDYNCILPHSDPKWEKEHQESIEGAIQHYGYSPDIFFDCQKALDAAVENIADAINSSTADDPLYFILAGPMEVPYMGIEKSDPAKRKFVYCISHNRWNDGYASADLVNHNKRHVIPTGVTWVQIADQNRFLSTGPFGRPSQGEEWKPWQWLDTDRNDLGFLWQRLQATTRADCSDSGMAYFLMTGDEEVTIPKFQKLLQDHLPPKPMDRRLRVRLEAENYHMLDNFEVEYSNDRKASQRIAVQLTNSHGAIRTSLNEPYLANEARYDITVRYYETSADDIEYNLSIDGHNVAQWNSMGLDAGWTSYSTSNVKVKKGDNLSISVVGRDHEPVKIDYLELHDRNPFVLKNTEPDNPNASLGQIIVAGAAPGYLKYNGGGPAFLCGPDNPEDFLFRGELNSDGTRVGGGQETMIKRLAESGVNAFHCQMFRMQRCNIKDEGDDTHAPFIDHDPNKGLNQAVLDQWDGWLTLFEDHGIAVHLEFYNDATDVEKMGWTLDEDGQLHPDEAAFFEGIVRKFKHHKNILWGLEESCNKLPRSRTFHFKKLAELIAKTDNFNHPIVQSFVIPEDPEGDFPGGGGTSDDYIGDPHIPVVTWLHLVPHEDDYEAQHQEYLKYYKRDSRHFIVMKNETYHHPRKGRSSRIYMWSSAMAGLHTLEAYHHADKGNDTTLMQDGFINTFMEQTDIHKMTPRDDLAAGSTKWVLANPVESYIAYTYDYRDEMGVKGMRKGICDLHWFDTVTGTQVTEENVEVDWGDATWKKPDDFSNEVVLHIQMRE